MPLSKVKNKERMREARAGVQPEIEAVQPKHSVAYLDPDGRTRLDDGTLVQPDLVEKVTLRSFHPYSKQQQLRNKPSKR